jgi:hypothetical protein
MSFSGKMAREGLKPVGGCMSDHSFQNAYARVRGRYDDHSWFGLTPREITDLIYHEIRTIDRERIGSQEPLAATEIGLSPIAVAAE